MPTLCHYQKPSTPCRATASVNLPFPSGSPSVPWHTPAHLPRSRLYLPFSELFVPFSPCSSSDAASPAPSASVSHTPPDSSSVHHPLFPLYRPVKREIQAPSAKENEKAEQVRVKRKEYRNRNERRGAGGVFVLGSSRPVLKLSPCPGPGSALF